MEENKRLKHKNLIEKSKTGDRDAQYRLYGLYVDAMFNVAMRLTGLREDAEDVLQESFVEAFRKLDTFRYESTFGAWLKRIVVNRSINLLKSRRVVLTPFEGLQEPAVEEEEVPKTFELEKIKRGINELPEGYRQIITLYLIEGYDHLEIAEILGITNSTSKSQYHRAKKKLVEIINTM